MQTDTVISALLTYHPLEEVENKYRLDIISHIQKFPKNWWQRRTLEGHVTASAWVLNREKTHVLFLHHKKLNRWLQPGGHLDDSDFSPAKGALREAIEETGIKKLTLVSHDNPPIFDLDVHHIPARGTCEALEPAHFHYDIRYLVDLAPDVSSEAISISDESHGFRWVAIEEVEAHFEPSLARMARKTRLQQVINATKKMLKP